MTPHWTPGPWKAEEGTVYAPITDQDLDAPVLFETYGSTLVDELEDLANAQLAATAPELYEALKDLIDGGKHEGLCFDNGEPVDPGPCCKCLDALHVRTVKAIAALAKARGEKTDADQ